jgi:hypothetical protein
MAALDRRYDMLPLWAWRRPQSAVERLEAKIGAMESLIRENDRALAENLARIEWLNARHRSNRAEFARALARHRASLARLQSATARLPLSSTIEAATCNNRRQEEDD